MAPNCPARRSSHAIALAKAVGAKVTAFYAAPDYPMPAYADGVVYEPVSRKEYAKLAAQDADKILEEVAGKAQAAGVECKTAVLDRGGARGKRSSTRRRRTSATRS